MGLTAKTVVHWNSLPRAAAESPAPEVFEMQSDRGLDDLT